MHTLGYERLTKKGIRLVSGGECEADILIMASGLNLKARGAVRFRVGGAPAPSTDTWTHEGMIYSDVNDLLQIFSNPETES